MTNLVQHPQICPCRVKEPEFFINAHPWLRSAVAALPWRAQQICEHPPIARWGATAVRRLTDAERAIVHDELVEDIRAFKRQYGFPVEKWGF